MFRKTFFGAIINCVISHTACLMLVILFDMADLSWTAYCFEVHRCKLEQSPEEWRQAHAAPPLCHGDISIESVAASFTDVSGPSRIVMLDCTSGGCKRQVLPACRRMILVACEKMNVLFLQFAVL